MYVRVTNNSKNKIIGRFDGVDYPFPIGESKDVPVHVANHVFGFGSPDGSQEKMRALANLGYLRTSDELEQAQRRLGEIHFDAIEMVGVPVESEADDTANSSDMVPAVRPLLKLNAGSAQIGDVSPNADAGATAGGGASSTPPASARASRKDVV